MKDSYKDHQLKKEDPKNWFRGHAIISDQINREELGTVISQLERVLQQGTPGAVVEFGCYIGTTSHFIRRVLDEAKQSESREFHVYDSFEGLPQKGNQDSNAAGVDFEAGKLYVSKKEYMQHFRMAGLKTPVAHKGWFNEVLDGEVPEPIAFAFLDGDFYDSIISSLRLVWPKMSEHGIIVIDDYKRETLPGVERAITDFFKDKKIKSLRGEHNKAIIEL